MNTPDLTIVLNLHREGTLACATLRALSDTALHAGTKGLSVELVAVLDAADEVTRAVIGRFDDEVFARIRRIEVDNRSLGPSRNDGLAAAEGRYVVVVDGDDIYSFNYLAAMHAAVHGEDRCLAYPEYAIDFGSGYSVHRFLPLAQSGCYRLAGFHTFASCLIGPTSLVRDLGYRDCARSAVYAYEDYDLNCRAVAAGVDIRLAEDAILFYRKHERSIMAAIEDPGRFIVPPNDFFLPDVYAAFEDRGVEPPGSAGQSLWMESFRRSRRLAELVDHAHGIEPLIDRRKIMEAPFGTAAEYDLVFGTVYGDLCRALRACAFTDVVLVPTITGYADWVTQLVRSSGRTFLIVETEPRAGEATIDLPEGSRLISLPLHAASLPADRLPELTLRLVQNFAEGACLHVFSAPFADRFAETYAETLQQNAMILYKCVAGVAPDRTIAPELFSSIDVVVSDEEATLDALVARMPIYAGKVMLVRDEPGTGPPQWPAEAYARLRSRSRETRWTRS